MSNPFFTNTIDLLPATKAKAGDVEANLNAVEAGFDEAKEYFDRTLRGARANPAIPEIPNAATRANKALTFDASGNPVTTVTTTEISNAQTNAVAAAASAVAADASADAAAASAATALSAANDPNVVAVGSDLLGADTIGTVAGDIANVNSVAGNATNINAVAANATNINTVATNAASINTAATNIAAIIDAPNQASAAAASASAAASSYDSFDDRYLGSKASDPTLDNDGNALLTGALYWNSVAGEMRVWSGSAWIATYLPAGSYVSLTGDQTIAGVKTFSSTPVFGDNVQVIGGNTTAVRSRTYVLTATLTLTLPASPAAGDWVVVINRSATVTPVVARNGQNIMGLAENMTIDELGEPVRLVFADATRGWVLA